MNGDYNQQVKRAPRVDLNCGCPANTVTGNGAGSSLLRTPERLYDIVRAMVGAVEGRAPVSVKLRAGFGDTSLFEENLLAAQVGEGVMGYKMTCMCDWQLVNLQVLRCGYAINTRADVHSWCRICFGQAAEAGCLRSAGIVKALLLRHRTAMRVIPTCQARGWLTGASTGGCTNCRHVPAHTCVVPLRTVPSRKLAARIICTCTASSAPQEAGASFITLHPRTKRQAYSGAADWSLTARAVQLLRIPVVRGGPRLDVLA